MPLAFANTFYCEILIIAALLFTIISYIKCKRILKANFILIFLIFVFTGFTTVKNVAYYRREIQVLQQGYFERISLDNITSLMESKKSGILYIGRDNCDYCSEVYPYIRKFAYEKEQKIYYYNTLIDRDFNTKYMDAVFKKINVDSVPTVIIFNNGAITEQMDYGKIQEWILTK